MRRGDLITCFILVSHILRIKRNALNVPNGVSLSAPAHKRSIDPGWCFSTPSNRVMLSRGGTTVQMSFHHMWTLKGLGWFSHLHTVFITTCMWVLLWENMTMCFKTQTDAVFQVSQAKALRHIIFKCSFTTLETFCCAPWLFVGVYFACKILKMHFDSSD